MISLQAIARNTYLIARYITKIKYLSSHIIVYKCNICVTHNKISVHGVRVQEDIICTIRAKDLSVF